MEWLRTGDGEMFAADDKNSMESLIPQFISILNSNDDLRRLFTICMNRMSESDWNTLTAILQAFASGAKK